jgi:hypothetical protein
MSRSLLHRAATGAALLFAVAALAQRSSPPDLAALGLTGGRFAPLTWEQLNPEQRALIESVLAGPRGNLGGPFNVLLRSPATGDKLQDFGASMRFLESMPANCASSRSSSRLATEVGVRGQVHAARRRRRGSTRRQSRRFATGGDPRTWTDEAAVYEFSTELLHTHEERCDVRRGARRARRARSPTSSRPWGTTRRSR